MKIGLGYLLLLVWCYTRAEIQHRRAAHAATGQATAVDPAGRLRIASAALLVLAAALVIWGSGYWFLFWLAAGLLLTQFIQTVCPIRREWR